LADSKKIVIVGIPGVGKTSLVKRLVELIRQKNKSVSVHSYGTVMLEEAKKTGVEDIQRTIHRLLSGSCLRSFGHRIAAGK